MCPALFIHTNNKSGISIIKKKQLINTKFAIEFWKPYLVINHILSILRNIRRRILNATERLTTHGSH